MLTRTPVGDSLAQPLDESQGGWQGVELYLQLRGEPDAPVGIRAIPGIVRDHLEAICPGKVHVQRVELMVGNLGGVKLLPAIRANDEDHRAIMPILETETRMQSLPRSAHVERIA